MEGLEISEDRFSKTNLNKDFRIDSQFYTKAPRKNSQLKYIRIGDAIKSSQYGLSIEMTEDGQGFPIYRMNEIHDMLCDLSVDKYANISEAEYERFALHDGDVLFNRTNSFEWVGRTGVYYQNDDVKRTFASYLVKFIPNEQVILPEYLCAFLNSKYGVWDIKRRARQSINQTNVNPEEVKEIEIPILDYAIQKDVQKCLKKANEYRVESLNQYIHAENTLKEELGIKDLIPNNEAINIKQLKESFLATGRLDAEYYRPKYDDFERLIKSCKCGYGRIRDYFNQNTEVFTEKYSMFNYIEIGDINIATGEASFNEIAAEDLPDNAKRKIYKDDLLISKVRPYRGAVSIIDFEKENLIASGAFTVLQEKTKYKKEVLQVLLRTPMYKEWLMKWNVGSSYPVIKDEDVLNLIVPIIPEEIQDSIAKKVQESIALRAESKRLLEKAKTLVEQEIESR